MGCREFFLEQSANKQRCKVLQTRTLETQLEWESESASEFSPKPVSDDEDLVRYWLNPVHFDTNTSGLKPTAFEDAANKGLSVNRLAYTSITEIRAMAHKRVEEWIKDHPQQFPRELIGYSVFGTNEVRDVKVPGPPPRRALGVYDTAQSDDPSHSDVCELIGTAQGIRSVRSQMWRLLSGRLKRFS